MDIKQSYIAIICDYELLEDRVGGMDYFFWAFNRSCLDKNINVDWFFPNIAIHGSYHSFSIKERGESPLEAFFVDHIKSSTVKYSHIITHFVELCTSFFYQIKKFQNAKIIVVDHNPRPLNGYLLKKRLKKKVKGVLYSKYIDEFIGVSEYTSQEILKDFGRFLEHKTKTIYNGVLIDDIIVKSNQRRKMNPKFLVVSHLRYSKGIQDLIKAVHQLSDELKSNLTIDVYGDGPYKNELKALIDKYELNDVFEFMGSNASINVIYQEYDYMLQPTHMECFSLSILESLAANIPVITTSVGGNTEVVYNEVNGYIFEAKSVIELSKLLEEVIKGEKSIEGTTRPLIEEHFSIITMVKNHLNLLK